MSTFDDKYGIQETDAVKAFHASRRMFCVYNARLYIAPAAVAYSHAQWFTHEGWMSLEDDRLMNHIPRGIVDAQGDIYFYVGYDFEVNRHIENVFFAHLPALVKELKVAPTAKIYGGLIKQEVAGTWPARTCYGTVEEVVNSPCCTNTSRGEQR